MADERYTECFHCGARDQMVAEVLVNVVPGDGVVAPDMSWVQDVYEWRCRNCDTEKSYGNELGFIGWPGMTEQDKEDQRG